MNSASDRIEAARRLLCERAAERDRPAALLASAALCATASVMLAVMVILGPGAV